MATVTDVRRIALGLPGAAEKPSHDGLAWQVGKKSFAWERPLRKSDLAVLGDEAPDGPNLGVYVSDEGEKQALLDEGMPLFFTIPHLDGWPIVLVRLDAIGADRLYEVIVESWLARAPKKLAEQFLADGQ